jgi:hypothetical protein
MHPHPERRTTLRDIVLARMRTLFPASAFVRALNGAMNRAVVPSGRSQVKACAFPAVRNGLCKAHALDLTAEHSVLPSCAAQAILPPPPPKPTDPAY